MSFPRIILKFTKKYNDNNVFQNNNIKYKDSKALKPYNNKEYKNNDDIICNDCGLSNNDIKKFVHKLHNSK